VIWRQSASVTINVHSDRRQQWLLFHCRRRRSSTFPPPAIVSEMEDELSDVVARFVLQAGGLEKGVYTVTRRLHTRLPNINVRSSEGRFEGICKKACKVQYPLAFLSGVNQRPLSSAEEVESIATPSTSIATLSPLRFSPQNALDAAAAMPERQVFYPLMNDELISYPVRHGRLVIPLHW